MTLAMLFNSVTHGRSTAITDIYRAHRYHDRGVVFEVFILRPITFHLWPSREARNPLSPDDRF